MLIEQVTHLNNVNQVICYFHLLNQKGLKYIDTVSWHRYSERYKPMSDRGIVN